MSSPDQIPKSLQEKRELLASLLRQKAAQSNSLFPLSYGQQALWFLYQSNNESAAYNTAFAARIPTTIDEPAMRHAFREVVSRHPSLRTTFFVEDSDVVQRVNPFADLELQRIHMPEATQEELDEAVIRHYQQPFNLETGPLMRVALFTRAACDHVLLVTVHHIVSDAWSLWIIADEVTSLYSAALKGDQASLRTPTSTYADFVRWQKQLLSGKEGEYLRTYWKEALQGDIPVLTLPTDRPRPAVRSWQGSSLRFELPGGLWKQLGALAQSQGATLFTVLLAAFEILLHRYSNQHDFTFGSITNGRTRPEFAGVVGYFVNPVVIRADLRRNSSFMEFLATVRESMLGALAHQDYPFPMLVEQLSPIHDRSRTPLMDVLFVYQQSQVSLAERGSSSSGLQWLPFHMPQMEGQFDLTLEVTEGGKSALKYDTALFNSDTIARMAKHLEMLLRGIASRPEARIGQLPLLNDEERRDFTAWNDTQADFGPELLLHERFSRQVQLTPDNVAVAAGGSTVTYRMLDGYANSLARSLRAQGVGPERLVGVCLNRSIELVVALLGILKAGGAYVPLDPTYPEQRLAFMANDAGLQVVLTEPTRQGIFAGGGQNCTCMNIDLASMQCDSEADSVPGASPDQLAYVIYTSGSTGEPKGAMNTHRAICNRLIWMQQEYGMREGDRVLQKTPFTFDVSVWEFFWPLLHGACLVMAKPGGHMDCKYLLKTIESEGITILHFVPSMLRVFLQESGLEACRTLRHVFCSGEALPAQLQNDFYARIAADLHNLYGPTEAAVDVTYWLCERDGKRLSTPIGRPISNTQIYILDAHLQSVPIGVVGELYIGGVNLGRGYLGRPDLTAERFVPDAFADNSGARLYRTGDLAKFGSDGAIEYVGRTDHQVKIRGFRIELSEIEAVLGEHPNLSSAVVATFEQQKGEPMLAAYFVKLSSPPPSTTELRQFLLERLPEYMTPSVFVELQEMPLTTSGKVDRRHLPPPEPLRPNLANVYAGPETQIEGVLAQIWQQVLRIDRLGIHDNFFDIGGHSLRMTQVIALIEQQTGRRISIVEAFEHPTIHTLARHLSRSDKQEISVDNRAGVRSGQRLRVEHMRNARQKHRAASEA